eukprot:CAMPEP_0174380320 /NCGR_PEP_ID=MMETSP0811_2-20130205/123297_1 /TAXON_ID=73025 ORGANISM="Eutreptiella gymnastica-like, Strain CCMP1594" /NCGR_SAMPLE_ID=MMETSP0811_2 /ASSEMBLY_ACC=CAM_ASM_000667 /LENGTH=162 /DNA_ID=CAMNT_0015533149 /DNA_START=293 /DNA_END=782 /DNA_ORIENTATION=+
MSSGDAFDCTAAQGPCALKTVGPTSTVQTPVRSPQRGPRWAGGRRAGLSAPKRASVAWSDCVSGAVPPPRSRLRALGLDAPLSDVAPEEWHFGGAEGLKRSPGFAHTRTNEQGHQTLGSLISAVSPSREPKHCLLTPVAVAVLRLDSRESSADMRQADRSGP